MRHGYGRLFIITTLGLFLALTSWAQADLGISWQVRGSFGSQTATNVVMRAEDVRISLTPAESIRQSGITLPERMNAYFKAHVSARFVMRNTASEEETVRIVFPVKVISGAGPEEASKLQVKVDGRPVASQRIELSRPIGGVDVPDAWEEFSVRFPAAKDVNIEVVYDVDSAPVPKTFEFTEVAYVMETGADWKGPIGRGKVTVEMPFPYSDTYVESDGGGPWTTQGNSLVWEFADLEPDAGDNVSLRFRTEAIGAFRQAAYLAGIKASSYKEADPPPAMVEGTYVDAPADRLISYFPFYAVDADPKTAWAVYRPMDSDPWLAIELTGSRFVDGLDVVNGFAGRDPDVPAIKGADTLIIEFSDGLKRMVRLKDKAGRQRVTFPATSTDSLKIYLKTDFSSDRRFAISEVTPRLSESGPSDLMALIQGRSAENMNIAAVVTTIAAVVLFLMFLTALLTYLVMRRRLNRQK